MLVGTWVFSEIVDPVVVAGECLVTETGRLEETAIRFSANNYEFLRKDVRVLQQTFQTLSADDHTTVIVHIPDYTLLEQPLMVDNPAAQAAMRRTLDSLGRRQATIETAPGSIIFRDLVGRKLRYVSKPKP